MRLVGRLVLGLVVLVAFGVVSLAGLWWAPDQPASVLAARWGGPPSMFLPLDGMKVHVRDEGRRDDPMPLVLIHGTSSSLHTWDGWTAGLVGSRRVVRMDLPGFGLTGPSPDADYTPETYARFVVQLMDGLAIKRAVLVGNSLGGGIAWLVAVTAPDRVGKLVLIDAAGYPQHAVSVPIGFKLAQMPLLAPVFTHILPRRVVEASLKDVYGDPSRVTPGLVDQYYDMTVRAGNRAALGQKMAQSHFEPLAGEIAQVKAPTLILWGTEDRLISPANAERFHKDIPGSVVVMLPGLGHVPMEEDPVGSLKAASVFLEE